MTTRATISASTLNRNLAAFSDMVYGFTKPSDGTTIVKIPYADWKVLTRMARDASDIHLTYYHTTDIPKTVTLRSDATDDMLCLSAEPGTFGEYLMCEHKMAVAGVESYVADNGITVTDYIDTSGNRTRLTVGTGNIATNWYYDTTTTTTSAITATIAQDYITTTPDNTTEKEDMNTNKFMNFEFGPCTGNNIRMSMYGLAVKNASGTWVS